MKIFNESIQRGTNGIDLCYNIFTIIFLIYSIIHCYCNFRNCMLKAKSYIPILQKNVANKHDFNKIYNIYIFLIGRSNMNVLQTLSTTVYCGWKARN